MGVTVIDYNQPEWLAEFNRRGERIAELESAIRRCCRNCWANDATDAAQCRLCGLKEALEGAGNVEKDS